MKEVISDHKCLSVGKWLVVRYLSDAGCNSVSSSLSPYVRNYLKADLLVLVFLDDVKRKQGQIWLPYPGRTEPRYWW